MNEIFHRISHKVSEGTGKPMAFVLAVLVILAWVLTGPMFNYSDTWQLVINTGTTIVTFLMVFLIQNTQNRDSKAMHLKMDEIIRALRAARNDFMDLEDATEEEMAKLAAEFRELRKTQKN